MAALGFGGIASIGGCSSGARRLVVLLGALAAAGVLGGCSFFPTAHRTVAVPTSEKGDVLEIAIEAAQSVDLPPPTKIDKANGVVEFGSFDMPVLGYTAQVRVKANGQLDITVKRGSIYVPLDVDPKAQEFASALESRLQTAR